MLYFFTADQHYGHENCIKHCNRPFHNKEEMDSYLIERHNQLVGEEDVVFHLGDFCWYKSKEDVVPYIRALHGKHFFIKGSHDHWIKERKARYLVEKKIEGQYIVLCHYPLRTWPRSHYGSWQLHGHSHGRLDPLKNQWDVGVDGNQYAPVSFHDLQKIMDRREE